MSLFSSMNWFKSNRDAQIDVKIKKLEKKLDLIRMDCLPPMEPKLLYVPGVDPYKPYKKVKLVNDVLTIILNDGSVISKCNSTYDDFMKVRNAISENEVLNVISSPEGRMELDRMIEETAKVEKIRSNIDLLVESGEFEFRNDALYMTGVDRSIPELLVEEFSNIFNYNQYDSVLVTTAYQSLKKFWLKCCLNPSAQSAEDLYTFLSNHQFKIDKHGNFYAYRRVVNKNNAANGTLVNFISNAYNKVKAVWKKSPKNFAVYKDEGINDPGYKITGSLIDESEYIGNLDDLYKDLPNMEENSYTDAHTHSFDYRVGQVASMPRHEGDDNNQVSCSKGFHSASKAYDYSGFGDTPILMIINPMDVLAVPLNEVGKLRVCRWFFATTLPEDEKYILDDDEFDVTDLGDEFEEICMRDLTNHVQTSFAEEVQRHTFGIPQLSAGALSSIVHTLEEMQEIISKRVSLIK